MAKIILEAKTVKNLLELSTRFDKCLKNLKIESLGNGKCTATLKVSEEHTNPMGTLHGGLSATLVDSVSSWALFTHEQGNCVSVSVNINMTYMSSAKEDEEVQIEADTLKVGKTLAFLQVLIKNKSNGNILAKGEHTKYLMRKSEKS